jgi:hypothetical protein
VLRRRHVGHRASTAFTSGRAVPTEVGPFIVGALTGAATNNACRDGCVKTGSGHGTCSGDSSRGSEDTQLLLQQL